MDLTFKQTEEERKNIIAMEKATSFPGLFSLN